MPRAEGGWHRLAAIGAIATILSGCGGASGSPTPAPTPTAGLFVDAGSDRGNISSLVYGSTIGPGLGDSAEINSRIVSAGLTTVSFPGGSWGDENDIQADQVDQLIASCKRSAAPRIVARLKGGTAQAAADLVTYANVTKGYGVRYWGIGNEPDLYEANGQTGYDVDRYNAEWRSYAQAMKAVDPGIKLVGPDLSQFVAHPVSADQEARTSWLISFLKANGDLVDVVSVHRYPFPADAGTAPTKDELRANGREWDNMVAVLREIAFAETGRNLPVAVTAANSSRVANSGGEATLDSHYNAIWWADVLGRLIRQDAYMVDQDAVSGDRGIFGPNGPGPIFNVYQLYSKFGYKQVRAVSDDPLVSIFAARQQYGTLELMIVNLASTPQTKQITVIGWKSWETETWLFDETHPTQMTGRGQFGDGTVTLPPESVTLLIVGTPIGV